MRRDILKMALAANTRGAHLGGSLSLVEIMAALYGVMRIDPRNMTDGNRDRLILSKGHGVMAQYAALRQLGVLTEEDLRAFKAEDSPLTVHPAVSPILGIDCATGSLGQGLSFAIGMALGLRLKGNAAPRVFVVLGDGECNEGAVWEAAMYAAHVSLGNLVVIVDKNGIQNDGFTKDIVRVENMEDRWRAFGWEACSVDGHAVPDLEGALRAPHTGPLAVIARTIKGKGVSFMENVPQWHYGMVTDKIFAAAMHELEAHQ